MAEKKRNAKQKERSSINGEITQMMEQMNRLLIEERRAVPRDNERIEIIGPAEIEWNVPAVDEPIQYRPQHEWERNLNAGGRIEFNLEPIAIPNDHQFNRYIRQQPYVEPRAEIRGQRVEHIPPVRNNERGMPVRDEVQQPREAPPDPEWPERCDDGNGPNHVVVHEVAGVQYRYQDWQNLGPMGLRYRQQEVDPGGQPPGRPGPVQPARNGDGV